jgi:hypothetical protein
MVVGMTVRKITISVPAETLAKAQGAIRRGRARSVSAYFVKAAEEKLGKDDLLALLDEMLEETGGPLTPVESRHADRALGIKPRRRPKPR